MVKVGLMLTRPQNASLDWSLSPQWNAINASNNNASTALNTRLSQKSTTLCCSHELTYLQQKNKLRISMYSHHIHHPRSIALDPPMNFSPTEESDREASDIFQATSLGHQIATQTATTLASTSPMIFLYHRIVLYVATSGGLRLWCLKCLKIESPLKNSREDTIIANTLLE